ncbi:MAG: hypothetical protein IPK16_30935 [Anaerolineales bacterium]|nr:hypothetical protein [Anaerolineales bacterium]
MAYDIDVFVSVLGQREKEVGTPAMQKTLAMADRLAADALAPAVRHRLVEQTAVLTYFQKATTIRLIPYAPLALVGFDLTALVELPRLLALAHEVGHHVYRQFPVNDASEPKAAPAEALSAAPKWPEWLNAWEEEVFADVYGVLIAGPAAVLAMQAMVMANLPARLTVDDGDHPAPILRPALMSAVLHEMARRRSDPLRTQLERTADVLDKRWNSYLASINAPAMFRPKHARARCNLQKPARSSPSGLRRS